MSDSDSSELTPLEKLLQKHRKERKDLQAKVQILKKSKGDKKKKKEVVEEIANLESELNERHAKEINHLNTIAKAAEEEKHKEIEDQVENVTDRLHNTKIGKAQRRRDKKANEQKERDERIRSQEKENVHGARNQETETIKKILRDRDLMIHEIPSDGNCLYCAVLHQKPLCSVSDLRKRTATRMMDQPDEYLPYLTSKKTQTMMSEEEFAEYCESLATTTAWAGQVEVKALTHVFQSPIEIVQATGPSILLGEEYEDMANPIIICYHRHMYRLGAHYNSVRRLEEPNENDAEFQEPK